VWGGIKVARNSETSYLGTKRTFRVNVEIRAKKLDETPRNRIPRDARLFRVHAREHVRYRRQSYSVFCARAARTLYDKYT